MNKDDDRLWQLQDRTSTMVQELTIQYRTSKFELEKRVEALESLLKDRAKIEVKDTEGSRRRLIEKVIESKSLGPWLGPLLILLLIAFSFSDPVQKLITALLKKLGLI